MDRGIVATSITVVEDKPTGEYSAVGPIKVDPIIGSTPAVDQVRVVSVEDYKHAALSLAEAFKEDEVARYFVDTPDRAHWTEEQKWDLHCDIMDYITYAHCLKGMVTTIGADYGAVALW